MGAKLFAVDCDGRVRVPNLVAFVQDGVPPFDGDQDVAISLETGICSDQDMTVLDYPINDPLHCRAGLSGSLLFPVIRVVLDLALIVDVKHAASGRVQNRDTKWRPPAMEFVYPLPKDSGRGDHNHGFVEHLAVVQGGNE